MTRKRTTKRRKKMKRKEMERMSGLQEGWKPC